MSRLLASLFLVLALTSVAVAQMSNPLTPGVPCYLCVEPTPMPSYTPPAPRGNTWQQYAPTYDNGPGPVTRGGNRHALNDRMFRDPALSRGAEYMWPTPELQMQHERNALEEYNAGYGCNSWTLEGC